MATPKQLDGLEFCCNEGVFVLKHDVVNRKPDRRYKRQFDAAETWKAGLLIAVRTYLDDERVPVLRACPGQGVGGDIICHRENKGQWEPLLNALDNPPQNIKTLFAVLDFEGLGWLEPTDILAALLKDQEYHKMLRAARDLGQMYDDDFSVWRKAQGL